MTLACLVLRFLLAPPPGIPYRGFCLDEPTAFWGGVHVHLTRCMQTLCRVAVLCTIVGLLRAGSLGRRGMRAGDGPPVFLWCSGSAMWKLAYSCKATVVLRFRFIDRAPVTLILILRFRLCALTTPYSLSDRMRARSTSTATVSTPRSDKPFCRQRRIAPISTESIHMPPPPSLAFLHPKMNIHTAC